MSDPKKPDPPKGGSAPAPKATGPSAPAHPATTHQPPTQPKTSPQTDVGAGQEQVVKPNPDEVRGAALDAQAERARAAGLAAPPGEGQKRADEPIPNWAVPQDRPGTDPLAGMPPEVLDALTARLAERLGVGAGFQVPTGMKLVPAAGGQMEKSLAEQEIFRARSNKTTTELSQEEAEKLFPPLATDSWFRCRLVDGNANPVIYLPAADATSAAARYMLLCGIRTSDKPVSVVKQTREVRAEYRDYEADERERLVKPKKEKE